MRLLRNLIAIALCLFAFLVLLGYAALALGEKIGHPVVHIYYLSAVICLVATAVQLFQWRPTRTLACQHCEKVGNLWADFLGRSRMSILAFFFGGVLVLCYHHGRSRPYRCGHCDTVTRLWTPGARIGLIWLRFIGLSLVLYLYAASQL
ncbi:MAG: hypothetical protein WDN28_02360 [Chthoniobacter sp.]